MNDYILQDIKLPEQYNGNGNVLDMHNVNTRLKEIYPMFGSGRYQETGKCAQLSLSDELKSQKNIRLYKKYKKW